MKLNTTLPLPQFSGDLPKWTRDFVLTFTTAWADLAKKINQLSTGRLQGKSSSTAAPTTGTWMLGDFVANSNPVESGTAGSKYVIDGWVCVTLGTPGLWVEKRFLTGN